MGYIKAVLKFGIWGIFSCGVGRVGARCCVCGGRLEILDISRGGALEQTNTTLSKVYPRRAGRAFGHDAHHHAERLRALGTKLACKIELKSNRNEMDLNRAANPLRRPSSRKDGSAPPLAARLLGSAARQVFSAGEKAQ